MLVVSAVGLVLGGHYVKALANQFRDGVHKVVPAETHAEAGQVAIQESEDELVKAHLAMSKELESVPEKEAELTKLQQSEAELLAKLAHAKSLLKTEMMVDSKDLPGLSNDVQLLVTALNDVRAKRGDLLSFLQGVQERHAKFTRDARELLDKLDNAKLKLAEGVAKQHSEQAKALLAKANQSAEKLKGLTTLVDRSDVLEQIRTPQLSDQMSTTHTVENLINEIDVALK
jgi:hypothetical protein